MFFVLVLVTAASRAQAVESDAGIMAGRTGTLIADEFNIASDTPDIELYVRNKRPIGLEPSADRTVLFVHGTTYPAVTGVQPVPMRCPNRPRTTSRS